MKVLRIGRGSRRDCGGHALEHFQPARMRAGVPGERLRYGLLEREVRAAPHLRERHSDDRLARPARIVTRLRRLDLISLAVGGREGMQ